MESLSGRLVVILIIIGFIFCTIEAWGVEWKRFHGSGWGGSIWFYDVESIHHPSNNIVRVWAKEDSKDLGYTLWLYEFECLEKKRRPLAVRNYLSDGSFNPNHSYDFKAQEWGFMTPGSLEEALYKKVCK